MATFASAFRWYVLGVLCVLVLLEAELVACQSQFHFQLSTPFDSIYKFQIYNVKYDLIITGTETAPGSGKYLITDATGTRTYDKGTPDTISNVNILSHKGVAVDNYLYFPKSVPSLLGFGYLDAKGIGFTLDKAQTILPTVAASTTVEVYFKDGFYVEATGTVSNIGYLCTVSTYNAGGNGDPVFNGFRGQRFLVEGQTQRVYNILSLPSLQLNSRFIPLLAGQAMNKTEQAGVRQRQSRLIAALKKRGESSTLFALPATTTWSHGGLYMGETGVQIAGHRLLVKPGAYEAGFELVELDGTELPVSSEAVVLLDGSSVLRSTSSVVEVVTVATSFSLVNSDHFLNIQSARVNVTAAGIDHVDGILGQTLSTSFKVEKTDEFTQHVENDFLIPAGEDELWSTEFEHNRYVLTASTN